MAALRSKVLAERVEAVAQALSLVEAQQQVESSLIDAAADAFFMAKVHDAAARSRFVDLFRACTAISGDAARHVYNALFSRLEKRSAADVDELYEAAFVIKQIARTGERQHVPELVPHVEQLITWIRETIELPPAMRTRISPGNLSALLLNLALAGCGSDRQRVEVGTLATEAKFRHRVEPPAVLRSSPPPAASFIPPPPPPPPPYTALSSNEDDAEIVLDDEVISVAIPKPPPLPSRPPPLPPPKEAKDEEPEPPAKKKRAKAAKSTKTKARAPRSKRSP